MYVNIFVLNSNPFFESYLQSDLLGKLIFLSLYALSICSWSLLLYKTWVTYQAKAQALRFYEAFQLQRSHPLSLECDHLQKKNKGMNPFLTLYQTLKKSTLEVLAKNRPSNQETPLDLAFLPSDLSLSLNDLDYIASHLSTHVMKQVKELEKNLYILSTTVSLAPFLGLLGTVWGILMTFADLQSKTSSHTNDMVLGGLSMALATTVLGLLDAIPALIGYNYLKNSIRDFNAEMEIFSHEALAAVELHYVRVKS